MGRSNHVYSCMIPMACWTLNDGFKCHPSLWIMDTASYLTPALLTMRLNLIHPDWWICTVPSWANTPNEYRTLKPFMVCWWNYIVLAVMNLTLHLGTMLLTPGTCLFGVVWHGDRTLLAWEPDSYQAVDMYPPSWLFNTHDCDYVSLKFTIPSCPE